MAGSPVPALIDGLHTAAQGDDYFNGKLVLDGPANTDQPGDFLMIGVEDPDLRDAANSAQTTEDYAHVGLESERDVTGSIQCAALSWNGEGDQKLARDRAYGMRDRIGEMCRGVDGTDGTYGVESLLWTSCGTREQLTQANDEQGALALLVFEIYFEARI